MMGSPEVAEGINKWEGTVPLRGASSRQGYAGS